MLICIRAWPASSGCPSTGFCPFIHPPHMFPDLLIAVFACSWLARLPLFLGDAFEMPIPVLIQAMISHKHGFNDIPSQTFLGREGEVDRQQEADERSDTRQHNGEEQARLVAFFIDSAPHMHKVKQRYNKHDYPQNGDDDAQPL
jgi:hypothetical protein